ncbi:ABC transporter substrate-binding protein [Fluviispira vulneris]|uniref:ABC transporter substrate-binding protein n=1 Tax=Fluviispira vulneris TaxID=2763012 RepID=UPI0016440E89|nr:ABC transporter substrate-binding protein [Fluviispira vulneris]
MYLLPKLCLIFLITLFSKECFSLKEVRIHAIYPFFLNHSTVDHVYYPPSLRLQIFAGIPMALMYYQDKAEKCGYYFSYKTSGFNMYDHEDLVQCVAKINYDSPWVVFGPEKNTAYSLVNSRLNSEIPHVSSFSLLKSNGNNFTLSPDADIEIEALFTAAKQKGYKKNFVIIYDNLCGMCKEYQESILKKAKSMGFHLLESFPYRFNSIDKLNTLIAAKKPDFVFLNVKAADSGSFMSKSKALNTFFLGTKIWGDDVGSSPALNFNLKSMNGLTVRPLPPGGYNTIKLRVIDNNFQTKRMIDNPYYMKFFIESVTNTLCKYKPKNKSEFYQILKEKQIFKNKKYEFAVYNLNEGDLVFERSFWVHVNEKK